MDALAIWIHKQLCIYYSRWENEEQENTYTKLAQALKVTEKELTFEEMNGKQVVIAPYHNEQDLKNILGATPKLGNCLIEKEDVDMEAKTRNHQTTIKVR